MKLIEKVAQGGIMAGLKAGGKALHAVLGTKKTIGLAAGAAGAAGLGVGYLARKKQPSVVVVK